LALLFCIGVVNAQVPLTQISTDTFTNTTSQHATEVEPASWSQGSTIVSVFQIGRFTDGGSSDIGFSTSTNGGGTWTHGNLPGITKLEGTGTYDRASDPSVTYNVKFKLWLAETLALSETGGAHGAAVLVSSSTDGITWNNPATVSVVERNGFYDKPWIGCDNNSTSPHYGNCYVEWDDFSLFDQIEMSTSTDGGKTWSAKQTTSGRASGNGGIPLVQPDGTVIVPIDDPFLASVLAFKSTDGGATWTAPVTVAFISEHTVAGGMRALPLIAAQMDGAGKVYVVWQDNFGSIHFNRSLDSGATWLPSAITLDAGKIFQVELSPVLQPYYQVKIALPNVEAPSGVDVRHRGENGKRRTIAGSPAAEGVDTAQASGDRAAFARPAEKAAALRGATAIPELRIRFPGCRLVPVLHSGPAPRPGPPRSRCAVSSPRPPAIHCH